MRHLSRPSIAPVVLLLTLLAGPVEAQRWEMQATGSQVRFDTASALGSFSLSPFLEYQRGPVYASMTSAFTAFQGSQWATQGSGTGSFLFAPIGRSSPFRVELVGVGSGTVHSGGYRTASMRGEARLHFARSNAGAWVGGVATTGWASNNGGLLTGVGPTAGVWGRYGGVRGTTTLTPLRIEGYWFPQLDAQVSLSAGPLDVTSYAGWRRGALGSGIEPERWAGASVSWWVTNQLALTVAGGHYPSEILQGLPAGGYLTAGIKIAAHRPVVPRVKTIGRPLYEVERGGGTLRFELPAAHEVAIVGDWTEWQPIPLRQGPGGSWILDLSLGSGVYRFNLVIDGKRWIVPDGVPAVDNGYGGKTGLLIVP